MYFFIISLRSEVPNFDCGLELFFDSVIRPKEEVELYAPGPGLAAELVKLLPGTWGLSGPFKCC